MRVPCPVLDTPYFMTTGGAGNLCASPLCWVVLTLMPRVAERALECPAPSRGVQVFAVADAKFAARGAAPLRESPDNVIPGFDIVTGVSGVKRHNRLECVKLDPLDSEFFFTVTARDIESAACNF